jgi:hypothetical protein
MSMLDLDAFDRAPLQRDPCDFVVVPHFVRPEVLAAVNRDFPAITEPGNFQPGSVSYGPAFEMLVKEIEAPEFRARVSAKLGIDLEPLRLEMTFRRFSEASDGNVHNDSRVKVVTALIYFNETWPHPGGRLRLLRSSTDVRDYAAEVEPVAGNLVVFRRSETSFHGFEPFVGERRSLQMYWVRPKKRKRGDKQTGEWLRRFKRLFKRG